jgi:hypothetical protein
MPTPQAQLTLASLVVSAFFAGCSSAGSAGDNPEQQAGFTATVSEARERGITPYWLGRSFSAGGLEFKLQPSAELSDFDHPSLSMQYTADIGGGYTGLRVASFGNGGSVDMQKGLSSIEAQEKTDVDVGPWQCELWSVSTSTQPVNGRTLLCCLEDADVAVGVSSGSTGVPGTDVNPLLETELLFHFVAQNLQPLPE